MRILAIILAFLPLYTIAQEETAQTYFDLGFELQGNGKHKDAIQMYTMALSLEDDHQNSLLQRAFCYSYLKQYEKAVGDYSTIIKHFPNHVWAYLSRGGAYNKLEEWDKAIADFNKVLQEMSPQDEEKIEAYNNRGFSKKGKGDQSGACADWKKAKKLGSDEAKLILKNNYCK